MIATMKVLMAAPLRLLSIPVDVIPFSSEYAKQVKVRCVFFFLYPARDVHGEKKTLRVYKEMLMSQFANFCLDRSSGRISGKVRLFFNAFFPR
jgi:hypothetical protein